MHARALMIVAAVAALAVPTVAEAKLIPVKHPRVLCICITIPASALPVRSEVELEALVDVELIAHSLDPLYASFQTTPGLQAQYNAVLTASGLNPYFKLPAA